MPPVNDLFLSEDLNKPENRINVALFGLMQQDWFRKWFLSELRLPTDAVVYPPTNTKGARPDLKAKRPDGATLAWIEVEVGTNAAQAEDYRKRYRSELVKTIWGKQNSGGDLSLEEIANYLDGQTNLPPQTKITVQYLSDQIRQALGEHSQSSQRANVSDEIWEHHPLVVGLRKRLGNKLERTTRRVRIGYLKADTVKEEGFSLRVHSDEAANKELSVMSITSGRQEIGFPSLPKLVDYLPDHLHEIAAYTRVLDGMGLDISKYSEKQRPSCPLKAVLGKLDELVPCLEALADYPRE